jgi:ribose/xylose/arabinose/galactoside ABC-type transport system permease subunit
MISLNRAALILLRLTPVVVFMCIVVTFALMSPRFLSAQNAVLVVSNAAHVAIVAMGMTFVLLIAGLDLSVGAAMYLSGVLISMYLPGAELLTIFIVAGAIGAFYGALNGTLIEFFRAPPFIVTLGTLFMGRGLGLWLSDTKTVFFPESVLAFGRERLFGIPATLFILVAVFLVVACVLRFTPFGRGLYAIGSSRERALRAGIPVSRYVVVAYVLCGILATVGGVVSGSQVAAAGVGYGEQKEFWAIAAAVLGGTSLFGGRGAAFGAIFGAVMVETAANGLVMINADPYAYPIIVSAIIILAVAVDAQRSRVSEKLQRRYIRPNDLTGLLEGR